MIPDKGGPSPTLTPLPPHPALRHQPQARAADRAARFPVLPRLKARPGPTGRQDGVLRNLN